MLLLLLLHTRNVLQLTFAPCSIGMYRLLCARVGVLSHVRTIESASLHVLYHKLYRPLTTWHPSADPCGGGGTDAFPTETVCVMIYVVWRLSLASDCDGPHAMDDEDRCVTQHVQLTRST